MEVLKYSTEVLKYSTEVSIIPWRGLNIPRGYDIFHGGVKYSREVSTIPRRSEMFQGGA